MFLRARRRVRPRVACLRGGAISGLGRRLLAAADGLLRALARAAVCTRALAVHRQPTAMANPPVGADLAEPLDRLRALAAEITLDLEVLVDVGPELRDLVLGEVTDLRIGIQAERARDRARSRLPDPVDVRQPDLEPLLIGEVHSGDACHASPIPG